MTRWETIIAACGIIWFLTLLIVFKRFRDIDKDVWPEVE